MNAFKEKLIAYEALFAARGPELEVIVRDPALDVEGYCVCWNTRISIDGPLGRCAKGGTRVTPDLTLPEIKMLASRMALKNAAAGLPLGGAKSGLKADPDDPEIETKYRRFVQLLAPLLKERGGIFGGFGWDIGTRPEYVHWACDELGSYRSFTGKPIDMAGSDYDREGIAGLGVAVAAHAAIEIQGDNPEDLSFAVQGLGAMGAAVVRYFSEYGAKLTAVADPRIGGTVVLPAGFPAAVIDCFSTQNYEGAKLLLKNLPVQTLPTDEILYQTCDVLFPCAVQDVITIDNCEKIAARYLVEGANNPTSFAAYDVLYARNVVMIPDIIANPGGIIAAFTEMTTTITAEENTKNRSIVLAAKDYTRSKIRENVALLLTLVEQEGIASCYAARYLALKNILGAP